MFKPTVRKLKLKVWAREQRHLGRVLLRRAAPIWTYVPTGSRMVP
jgi:hypothetical protein